MDNWSSDMKMLAEIIGEEKTMEVIMRLKSVSIYIPRPDGEVIRYFHNKLGGSVKQTATYMGVSERSVYRAMNEKKMADSQMTIFDAIAAYELENEAV